MTPERLEELAEWSYISDAPGFAEVRELIAYIRELQGGVEEVTVTEPEVRVLCWSCIDRHKLDADVLVLETRVIDVTRGVAWTCCPLCGTRTKYVIEVDP